MIKRAMNHPIVSPKKRLPDQTSNTSEHEDWNKSQKSKKHGNILEHLGKMLKN